MTNGHVYALAPVFFFKFYDIGRPTYLGYHYHILSLSDSCQGVEERNFQNNQVFTFYPYINSSRGRGS